MCGRFTLSKPEKIEKRYNTHNKLPLFKPNYNIAPNTKLPVITRNSPNKVRLMYWGFIPDWKIDSFGLINIRSETAINKPYFTNKLEGGRCLIPASGFYEWGYINLEGKEEKFPFYFFLPEKELFSFAGIYNQTVNSKKEVISSFAILTCPPNRLVKRVHNRMPVVIDEEKEDLWLNRDTKFNQIKELLIPYPSEKMRHHPVSKRVNSPINNDSSLTFEVKIS